MGGCGMVWSMIWVTYTGGSRMAEEGGGRRRGGRRRRITAKWECKLE